MERFVTMTTITAELNSKVAGVTIKVARMMLEVEDIDSKDIISGNATMVIAAQLAIATTSIMQGLPPDAPQPSIDDVLERLRPVLDRVYAIGEENLAYKKKS